MYNHSVEIKVLALDRDRRILIEWPSPGGRTLVEWLFTPQGNHATFVSIKNIGFIGSGDEMVKQAISASEGFALVLAGLKALLEHNVMLDLVPDRYPRGLDQPKAGGSNAADFSI